MHEERTRVELEERLAENVRLTKQVLGDLLSAIKANKQNLLALMQLPYWYEWFASVMRWAVVSCASSAPRYVPHITQGCLYICARCADVSHKH